jgi:DUF971 family protein
VRPPVALELERRGRGLLVNWGEGHEQPLSQRQLRAACPCAECRRIRLLGGEISVAADVEIEQLQPMGYGVQIVFSDGHARGIFPWRYLAELGGRSS